MSAKPTNSSSKSVKNPSILFSNSSGLLTNAETSDFNFLLNSEMILSNIHLSSSKEMFSSVLNIESILEEYVS